MADTDQGDKPLSGQSEPDRSITGSVVDALSKVGTIAAALTAIAYLAVWLTLRSYYGAMGAVWYASNISPTKIMQEGAGTLTVLLVATYFGLQLLMSGRTTQRVDHIAKWWAIGAIALAVIGAVCRGFSAIGPYAQYAATVLAGGTLLVSVGLTIALLLWMMRARSPS